jgi:anti-anti-sigma factor
MSAALPVVATAGSVRVHHVGNGLVVRLSGVLDGQAVPDLRRGLLAPVAAGRRDVLVDAGQVERVDDDALAVLVAGSSWATATGGRFALSAASSVVLAEIETLGLDTLLPLLAATV